MSLELAKIRKANKKTDLSRAEILALMPKNVYDDGRTKQSFKDETNIVKIMARADKLGTISHLQKFEGVYADFSDYDFHEQTEKLTQGRMIFDELPAEIRKEFGQSPSEFFAFVNDPANKDKLLEKLPHLALPGKQLIDTSPANADAQAAAAAASEPASANPAPTPAAAATPTPDATPGV